MNDWSEALEIFETFVLHLGFPFHIYKLTCSQLKRDLWKQMNQVKRKLRKQKKNFPCMKNQSNYVIMVNMLVQMNMRNKIL